MLRDRDSIYGDSFRRRVAGMGIAEIVCSPAHLRRLLFAYVAYYHRNRTHLGLGKDTPDGRPIQPASAGEIVGIPEIGGLHHRYERRAA